MSTLRAHLNSSFLASAEYDPDTDTLTLGFTTGKTYDFPGVPLSTYTALIEADSPGTYYHQNIRGKFG